MITIQHHDNQGCITVYDGNNPAGIKLDCYTRGWNKPNYPVPAIHYEAEFPPDIPPVLKDVHNGPWLLWSRSRQVWV